MNFNQIKFNCKYFKGDVPCVPNKLRGKLCETCDEYAEINKKILIIKLGALGDVIRTTPLVSKYKLLYPDCHISWITHTPEILTSKLIDRVYKFDFASAYSLKQMRFDIAVNLDKDPEACILLSEIKSVEKHGFFWDNNHIEVTNKAAEQKLLTGIFDSFSLENKKSYLQEIFNICNLEFNREKYLLDVDEEYFKKWEDLKNKSNDKKIIGLNTGCGKRWITRLWPNEYWLKLISMLQKGGFYPVLLGGPDENEKNIYFADKSGAFYPGTFSLKEFMAIIANCDLIVSAVSLTMHLTLGLQKPLVLFNNIFNKYEFEMYDNGEILEPDSGCECYYGNYCKREKHCMYDLLPEKVFNSIVKNI